MSGVKCINKFKKAAALAIAATAIVTFTSCGSPVIGQGSYRVNETSEEYGLIRTAQDENSSLMGIHLCPDSDEDIGIDKLSYPDHAGYAGGVFNVTQKKTLFAHNMNEKVYPASTTKILTAYTALKYGDLNAVYTVSDTINSLQSGSSLAELQVGDQLTLEQLLYGMLLPSGNDAALTIAEGISGSEESFVNLMNQEARSLGATHSHFVNCHGLHDDNHYTSVYDMYLIFSRAIQNPEFYKIISTPEYDTTITSADGSQRQITWKSTDHYLSGDEQTPSGITVVGGKTGTTTEAMSCLVLLSTNKDGDQIISIVYKAKFKEWLYEEMSDLLTVFGNNQGS